MFSQLLAVCSQPNSSQSRDLWLTGGQSLSNASATTQSSFSDQDRNTFFKIQYDHLKSLKSVFTNFMKVLEFFIPFLTGFHFCFGECL